MAFSKKINVKTDTINLSWTKLENIIKLCNPWEQFVLVEKYWIISWKSLPMQQIWNKFNMSRERIRQILNKSLWKIRRFIGHDEYLNSIIKKTHEIIKENWNIIWEENLINKLLEDKDIDLNYNELLLILSSDYDIYYIHRNKRFEKLFFIEPVFEDLINDIHDTSFLQLKENKSSLQEKDLTNNLKNSFLNKFQRNQSIKDVLNEKKIYENILTLSRHIYKFDWKIWLENNKDVNPKTMKFKIRHILSNNEQPMHYEEIANEVKNVFNIWNIKVPTIHNELVKWKDFINVWMWIYWLKQWWYKGPNTLETITTILRNSKRPMRVSEITKEVIKERLIREVTVLIVLQKHKDRFERVWKWLYKIKE